MKPAELEQARRLLCRLQDAIGQSVRAAQVRGSRRMSRVATVTSADTIYVIDKVSETTVLAWVRRVGIPRQCPRAVVGTRRRVLPFEHE